MSSTTYSWTDDGSFTGTSPSQLKERYYTVKIAGTAVKGREVAGVFRIEVQPGFTMVSFPLQLTVNTLYEIFRDQLTGDVAESGADRIWYWTGSGYRYAWKFDSGGVLPQWDDKWIETDLGGETTITVNYGEAFFVQNRHAPQSFHVAGFVNLSSFNKQVSRGYQTFGTPYPVEVTLGATGLWESGAHGDLSESYADRVLFWDTSINSFRYAWLFDSGGAFPAWDGRWIETALGGETTIMIKPGTGYFFQDKVNDFIWVFPKPFTEP